MNKYYIVYSYEVGKRMKFGTLTISLEPKEFQEAETIHALAGAINKNVPGANTNSVIIHSWQIISTGVTVN